VVFVVHLEMAIACDGRDGIIELVAQRPEGIPGQVRSDPEAADVGKARDKDAVIEMINAVEPNDGIDPALVFLELLVWQQTTSELHLRIDRPHTSAGEQIKRSVLGLDGAVRTAEG